MLTGQVIGCIGGYPRLSFGFHTLAHMSLHTVHPHARVFMNTHTHEHIQRKVHESHDSHMVQPILLGWRPHTGPKDGDCYEIHSSGHEHISQASHFFFLFPKFREVNGRSESPTLRTSDRCLTIVSNCILLLTLGNGFSTHT